MGQATSVIHAKNQLYKKAEILSLERQALDHLSVETVEQWHNHCRTIHLNDNELHLDTTNSLGLLLRFEKLESVNLSGNHLKVLPSDVCYLPKLKFLDLSRNDFIGLPSELARMTVLKRLSLADNRLDASTVRLLSQLSSLGALDIAGNNLNETMFPTRLAMPALTTLDVSRNRLNVVPPCIYAAGGLGALEQLNLSSNQLQRLPEEMAQLIALHSLDISRNSIELLDGSVSKLRALLKLNAGYNALSQLPDELALLRLSELNMRNNQLTRFPPVTGMESLQVLDVSGNQISSIPNEVAQLKSLKSMILAHNRLLSVPKRIGKLKALRKLDLTGNAINDLPPELGSLNLDELLIEDNPLNFALQQILLKEGATVNLLAYLKSLKPSQEDDDEPKDVRRRGSAVINVQQAADDEDARLPVIPTRPRSRANSATQPVVRAGPAPNDSSVLFPDVNGGKMTFLGAGAAPRKSSNAGVRDGSPPIVLERRNSLPNGRPPSPGAADNLPVIGAPVKRPSMSMGDPVQHVMTLMGLERAQAEEIYNRCDQNVKLIENWFHAFQRDTPKTLKMLEALMPSKK
eukprot:TRINITY_DN1640_c0_g1_i2.p1 TRINITY_DN1640_c0_g1~~TRINITY_DN1640_c0_g1_i2.p1  ORF type:complete len:575 (+),score=150.26 TRINITY_DN1640_c0_g1_i2:154-1878(+)